MKLKIYSRIFLFVIFILSGTVVQSCMSTSGDLRNGEVPIQFSLIDKQTIDFRNLHELWGIQPAEEITGWRQYTAMEYLLNDTSENIFNLNQVPEIDFDHFFFILTFGREMTDLRYIHSKQEFVEDRQLEIDVPVITFNEEYEQGAVYVYKMDKVCFSEWDNDIQKVYIMSKGNRMFWGRDASEINE